VEQLFIHKPKSSPFILYFLSLLTVGVAFLSQRFAPQTVRAWGCWLKSRRNKTRSRLRETRLRSGLWFGFDFWLICGWYLLICDCGWHWVAVGEWVVNGFVGVLMSWFVGCRGWVDLWLWMDLLVCGFVIWSNDGCREWVGCRGLLMEEVSLWFVNGGGRLGWFCGVCLGFHCGSSGFGLIWVFGGCGLI
jgi:hypothetical protein